MPCCKGEFYKYKVSDECGETKNENVKFNHIWTGFKEQTTAHGVPHVHQARGIFKTVFWTLISLACTGMLLYNLYYISFYYFSYKVDVVVSLNHRRELTFPAVSICNMNPIKESELYLSPTLESVLSGSSRRRRSPVLSGGDSMHSRSKRQATSYEIEEKAYEIMATLDESTKVAMGYNLSEFIIDCQYAGSNCHMDKFISFFDPNYGNCYSFNSGWLDEVALLTSKRAGRRHGMKFVLNVKQDEYIEALAQGAGSRILIHAQSRMPFPSDEGILATPGQITSIGIRQVNIERLDGNHGNCTNQEERNITNNVYEEYYPVNYTSTACFKTCYQKYVIEGCNCADPQYPRQGTAFGSADTKMDVCEVENAAQTECKDEISAQYQNNELDCYCPTQCNEVAYNFEVSNVEWPSEVHESVVLDTYADKFPDVVSANDSSTKLRKNVLKVEVYFQEFNYEQMKERPAYLPASYASDIGGILGLWLGLSVLSIFEFFELLSDICIFGCYRCRKKCSGETKMTDLTKNKNKPNSPPPPYSSNEALSNNSRNTLSHGLQDNVRTDGSLKYV